MRKLIISSLSTIAAIGIVSLMLVQLASAHGDRPTAVTATPRKVTFVFKNIGHVLHDFKINGRKTPLIAPGKTARLLVTFGKKAKYPYLCTVPGHAEAGMKGVFTVR